MNPIPKELLANYQESLFGRAKLNLFKAVAGKAGAFPTSYQQVKYFTELSKALPAMSAMVAEMFTTTSFLRWDIAALKQEIDTRQLAERLLKYPFKDPLFVEVTGNGAPMLVWINALGYHGSTIDNPHVVFANETFPDGVASVDIDLETSMLTCLTVKGSFTAALADWKTLNEPLIGLALALLDHRLANFQPTFISLQQVVENNWELKFDERHEATHDPVCADLLKKLFDRKIKLTMATVPIARVRPFSYEDCFEISLLHLETGLKAVDEGCLLVYEKDNQFIVSDDYFLFMALRLRELPYVKVAIMGSFNKKDVKVIATGGPELLPDVLKGEKPVSDGLSPALNENVLDAFLVKLRLADNAGDWSRIRCVILTEDKQNDMLNVLLESSGMHPDEIRIMSFDGCAQVGSLAIIIATLQQIKKDLRFVVHRDSDYLAKHEITKLSGKISGYGAVPLFTKGTDIESYFLDPAHINYLYSDIAMVEIEAMLQAATLATKDDSLMRFRKHKYQGDHKGTRAMNDLQIIADYRDDVNRYRYGKKTLGLLKGSLQTRLKNNPELFKPSPYLFDERMRELANEIWPDKILPWN